MGNLYLTYREGFPQDLKSPFLEYPDGSLITYEELEEQSSQYANGFSDLGLQPGDRVSVQVDKSPEVIFIYLACLRSNLIFHPLNTAYKESELSFFLDDAKPSVFICQKEIYENISSLGLKKEPQHVFTLLPLEGESIQSIKRKGDHEIVDCSEEHTAALLYSSGTTGKPKGIMLTHGNIGSNALALKEAWNFTQEDCLLHALPIYHVHGLFVALGCVFLSGSRVLWMNAFDADEVLKILPKCSVMMGVPTYYTRLLSNPKLNNDTTANIRVFISGSAPLLEDTFNEFRSKTGHYILERYGMTETNIICSNPIAGKRKPGTVGLPLEGQSLRIVDDSLNNLDKDEIGNIQVKGPNVFNGYWNLPEKTKEDFSSDNFFNTGDKGFIDQDGYLTIVGRSKDMIISGGLNVYPKEIESLIDDLDGVGESAVIGLKDNDLGEKVVAVVVRQDKSEITEDELITTLKQDIAGFKVPKQVIFIDELPRNAMGKVQKNVLRDNYQ
ncbi:MAG: malonyl-CoA synthase [Gammaproteobacteria bacterium]|nr:MAG: malonyl-CoA synthase [Gammaproteobacteria bacterium]